MKIGIKTFYGTYSRFANNDFESHCATYYTFLFRDIFRSLGLQCDFIGDKEIKGEIFTNYNDYDAIVFWGLESFSFDKYSEQLLKTFKGKKILYITAQVKQDIIQHFDYIFCAELPDYKQFYEINYPNTIINVVPFASPMFDFMDKTTSNPYSSNNKKIIYTGIITGRYLTLLNTIADLPYDLYVGGIYAPPDGTGCRPFNTQEIPSLFSSKVKFIHSNVKFPYGYHFPYLKHADLGLNFYPSTGLKSKPVNSKIIDYLCCGLPIICEDECPNSFRITNFNAGNLVKWNNINDILNGINKTLNQSFDKNTIQQDARELFNPLMVGKKMLEVIK